MTFLPFSHITLEHEYSAGNWQEFTSSVTNLNLVLREFPGRHTASVQLYNATLDPAQGTGTRIVKEGDRVRVWMNNADGTSRRTATTIVDRVSTAIDLKKPPGRQYLMTLVLHGKGVRDLKGSSQTKGVDTLDDLSDVITAAPFEIGGDGYGTGRTTAIGTSTEVAYVEVASEFDQLAITRDSNPGTVVYEDPAGTIQIFDAPTQRTGAATLTIGPSQYSDIDMQGVDSAGIINVLTIKYLEKIKTSGKATRIKEHDHTYVDTASRAKYGPHKKTHKVHKKSDFSAYADKVFAAHADPPPHPRSVVVPIRRASELLGGYEDGHYVGKKVNITSPDGLTTYVCRVTRINHQVTNRKWLVQVFLTNPTAVRHRRPAETVNTEVAHNPDATILNEAVDDDAIDSRVIATGAVTNDAIDDDAVDFRTVAPEVITALDDAQTAADDAQDTADEKARVTYSTGNPTGTPDDGDLWFKLAAGIIVGQWIGSAGAWVAATIDSAVIANLDAGKITTGILEGIVVQGTVVRTDDTSSPRIEISNSVDPLFDQGGLIAFHVQGAGFDPGSMSAEWSDDGTTKVGTIAILSPAETGEDAAGLTLAYGDNGVGSIANLAAGLVNIGNSVDTTDINLNAPVNMVGGNRFQSDGVINTSSNLTGNKVFAGNPDTTTGTANIRRVSTSQLQLISSLARHKYHRRPITLEDARTLLEVTPQTWIDRFEFHANGNSAEGLERIPGVVAEDVEKHAPTWATHDGDGQLDGVAYDRIAAGLIVVARDADERVAALEREVDRLRSIVETYINLGK